MSKKKIKYINIKSMAISGDTKQMNCTCAATEAFRINPAALLAPLDDVDEAGGARLRNPCSEVSPASYLIGGRTAFEDEGDICELWKLRSGNII